MLHQKPLPQKGSMQEITDVTVNLSAAFLWTTQFILPSVQRSLHNWILSLKQDLGMQVLCVRVEKIFVTDGDAVRTGQNAQIRIGWKQFKTVFKTVLNSDLFKKIIRLKFQNWLNKRITFASRTSLMRYFLKFILAEICIYVLVSIIKSDIFTV